MVTKTKSTYPWIIKKGTFTRYLYDTYGKNAFTQDGTIKLEYINKVLNDPKATTHRKKQAQFVKNARKFKHKGRK